ncbi:hypothetical protein J1G42_12725 [Cellulomonas sp. zg-ZUI222]|uniref:hypothetical protein n=1 Tax=Cellulomonas wangleii TaxID=2816956 RepID=UPI001A950449|nr:hypothetical protein [Cellulomonas wangleii]MBO0921688.1 hypothetical protein [Cellulomonas wangleii]
MRNRTKSAGGRRWVLVGAVLVVAAALAGCTTGDDTPVPTAGPTDPTAGLVSVGDGEAVVEFTAPGLLSYAGDVRVAVQPLTVEGRTMELRVTLTPLGGDDEGDDGRISIYDMVDGSPVLSDIERLTQYKVIGLPNDTMETDPVAAKTVVDEPVLYQAWFPAPGEDVEVLDLVLHPSWPTVTDVPVTRR